jgi:hypothetical protein
MCIISPPFQPLNEINIILDTCCYASILISFSNIYALSRFKTVQFLREEVCGRKAQSVSHGTVFGGIRVLVPFMLKFFSPFDRSISDIVSITSRFRYRSYNNFIDRQI